MIKNQKINEIIQATPDFEDENTIKLFKLTPEIKKQGFLKKDQAIEILKWKSPRPLKYYNQNSNEEFHNITKLAYEQEDKIIQIHILTALTGVKYPAASALLMFYDQKEYPVLDIRVWKQLHKYGLVTENEKGQAFTLRQCKQYFTKIRELAKENYLTARQVEKRLFDHDKKIQKGTLYKTYKK